MTTAAVSYPRSLRSPRQTYQVSSGRAGDHPAVQQMLQQVIQGPSLVEFQAELEEPSYEPLDRIVAKAGSRVVGHLRISKRELHFGGVTIPVALFDQMATLPETRGHGVAGRLLAAACEQAQREGAVAAFLRTPAPHCFERHGWCRGLPLCYSVAPPRQALAHLHAADDGLRQHRPLPGRVHGELSIRLWRHVEHAALRRIYAENVDRFFGSVVRSDAYWTWLLTRRAYEHIYIAINGPNKLELSDRWEKIVGYGVVRNGRIVELLSSPGYDLARRKILARACGDAIEEDRPRVRLDAPANESLHELLAPAGEYTHASETSAETAMGRLLDPVGMLRRLAPRLHQLGMQGGFSSTTELGLAVGRARYCITWKPTGVAISENRLSRSYLQVEPALLPQLLWGCCGFETAAADGRLRPSTRVAADAAQTLFPKTPVWLSPWDELWA